jgi:hypothetical protein
MGDSHTAGDRRPVTSVGMTVQAEEFLSTSPFQEFFRTEAAAGALLVFCAGAVFVAPNSVWADAYHRL